MTIDPFSLALKRFLFYIFLCSPVAAQIQWENQQVEFNATLQQTNVVANFNFVNTGNYPVKFTHIKSSCGCTTADLEKKNYQPGEKGSLTANFVFGQRAGFQEKIILIRTDDPKISTVFLKLRGQIPEVLKIKPSFLFWNIGETNAVKEVSLIAGDNLTVPIRQVVSSDSRFEAKLTTIKKDIQYALSVIPTSTDTPCLATLQIETDFPSDNPRTFKIQVMIVPARLKENLNGLPPTLFSHRQTNHQCLRCAEAVGFQMLRLSKVTNCDLRT